MILQKVSSTYGQKKFYKIVPRSQKIAEDNRVRKRGFIGEYELEKKKC